jgi:LacI family transcriptional regulator
VSKKPTVHDVSVACGLSVYTVSRALSNADGVSRTSRERVLAAAQELGYVANKAAQELRKNTRSSVAVLTASSSNYYYIDLMKGIQRTVRSANRTVVVADIASEGMYERELEDATVRELIQTRTAGVISTLTLSPANARFFETWDVPVVFVDSKPPAEAAHLPSVTTDNIAASTSVGAHLADHGYTDWLFLVYPGLWSTRADRERGIREAAAQFGARLAVIESQNDAHSAYATLDGYLGGAEHLPRAIIAGNNPMAHGVLRVLQDRRLDVPEDVAVIAFDEFDWARLLDPPLTVFNEDSEAIGIHAATTLMRLIDHQLEAESRDLPPTPAYRDEDRMEVGGNLIIRRSCGC